MKEETIKKLETLIDKDQENIRLFKEGKISGDDIDKANEENFEFIKKVFEEEGFPYKDITSEKAYTAWFLVTQHSGDLMFMKKMIPILQDADESRVDKKHIAYLVDRVNITEGKKQIYGTQFRVNNDIDFFEIEDEENVDERRKKLGMETLEEYRSKISSN